MEKNGIKERDLLVEVKGLDWKDVISSVKHDR